jgi:hypothetical protein
MVTAEQSCTTAPPAATCNAIRALDHEVRIVLDQLRIDAHDVERRLDARRIEVPSNESSYGCRHQRLERRKV